MSCPLLPDSLFLARCSAIIVTVVLLLLICFDYKSGYLDKSIGNVVWDLSLGYWVFRCEGFNFFESPLSLSL